MEFVLSYYLILSHELGKYLRSRDLGKLEKQFDSLIRAVKLAQV